MFRHTAAVRMAMTRDSAFAIKQALGYVSVLSTEHDVRLFGKKRQKMALK